MPPENRTLGWAILEWTIDYLQQPDGPNAGESWEYTAEQVRILLRWYAIDAQGRFAYRRGVLRRMKGWGKDPICATIAAIELCGPCRFGGWDAAKKPVAVQHPAPWIQVVGVSQDQGAHNTFRLFPGLFTKAAIDDYKIDLGKTIIYARDGNGHLDAVTSSPATIEGARSSFVIMNETHLWLPNNDGIEMADAVRRNLAKSRDGSARAMEITNAHRPGDGSVAELTYDAWKASGGKVAGLYYDSLEAPPVKDLHDVPALRDALTEARGDSTWLDVDRLAEEIADPNTPEYISRRFYLNQVVAVDAEKWLPEGTWGACADWEREIPDGSKVVLGFDGSYNGDATVLLVVLIDPVRHVDVVGWWEKDPGERNWRVPRLDVMESIRQACRKWRVMEIAVDPALWQSDLEQLVEDGLPVVEFVQRGQHMIDATQRFYELVTRQQMTHSGDDRLARHIANTFVKVDSRGARVSKEHKASSQHVDGTVASIMAVQRSYEIEDPPTPRVINMRDWL